MKLFGQVAQEPRARCGRGGCPVVIGAESPIRAGRGDGSSIQGPPGAGVPALRGAGADAPGHAALGMGHIEILIRHLIARLFAGFVPDAELHHSHLRIDGVARSGQ